MTFIILSAILILVIFVVAGIKKVNGNLGWKTNPKQWLAALGILLAIPAFFTVVPANNVGIVYSPFSGGVQEVVLNEGIKAKGPFDTVYHISTEVQTNTLDNLHGQTKDSQYLTISIDVKYYVDPTKAVDVFQKFRSLDNINSTLVRPSAQRAIDGAMIDYNIIEILGDKRSQVYKKIEDFLTTRFEDNGLHLHSITFLDTDGGEQIEQAIRDEAVEKKAGETAEQRRTRAEIEAETRIIQAEAEAKEKEILAAAISENPEILELEWIKKWNGILPIYMSDGSGGVLLDLGDLQDVAESMDPTPTPEPTPAPTPAPTEQASE
ncbi:MAG: prohibitin family protein [Clostridia bacterium]|jgi:prohibitin 1|nr:prohibitin family protein [Clostridia bacterium]MBT7121419.1 prohibitin family protein [Clostridia bacterium]